MSEFNERYLRNSMTERDYEEAKISMRLGTAEPIDSPKRSAAETLVQDIANLTERVEKAKIRVAMLSVPAAHAQQVTDMLVKAGVKAILNYAPINLLVPQDVKVQYIDPVLHLQRMSFYLE